MTEEYINNKADICQQLKKVQMCIWQERYDEALYLAEAIKPYIESLKKDKENDIRASD